MVQEVLHMVGRGGKFSKYLEVGTRNMQVWAASQDRRMLFGVGSALHLEICMWWAVTSGMQGTDFILDFALVGLSAEEGTACQDSTDE